MTVRRLGGAVGGAVMIAVSVVASVVLTVLVNLGRQGLADAEVVHAPGRDGSLSFRGRRAGCSGAGRPAAHEYEPALALAATTPGKDTRQVAEPTVEVFARRAREVRRAGGPRTTTETGAPQSRPHEMGPRRGLLSLPTRKSGLSCRSIAQVPRDSAAPSAALLEARERMLRTAYELFSTRGIRDVGVEELISNARVAKATFYRHFPSKDDLVLQFLADREQRWTLGFVVAGARARGETAEGRLLAIFDVFDDWFGDPAFDACSFINVLLEMGPDHRLGRASIDYLQNIRNIVQELAEEADLRDPESFARSWHILMKGSIISAVEGDRRAALRAKEMARHLITQHRTQPATGGA